MLEPSEASARYAEQYSRAHHRSGAASASDQHHPTLTRSHGGQIPNPTINPPIVLCSLLDISKLAKGEANYKRRDSDLLN